MKQVGRNEIIEELGQGAMGAVYGARDPMRDRVIVACPDPALRDEGWWGRNRTGLRPQPHPGSRDCWDDDHHAQLVVSLPNRIPERTEELAWVLAALYGANQIGRLGQAFAEGRQQDLHNANQAPQGW